MLGYSTFELITDYHSLCVMSCFRWPWAQTEWPCRPAVASQWQDKEKIDRHGYLFLFLFDPHRPHYSFKCPCGIVANRWKFLMQLIMTEKLTHHISSCCCRLAWAGKPCSLADVLRLALAHDSMVINSRYSAWRLLYVVLLVWLVAAQIFLSVHIHLCNPDPVPKGIWT